MSGKCLDKVLGTVNILLLVTGSKEFQFQNDPKAVNNFPAGLGLSLFCFKV
jgi:hypothetical protein